MNQLPIQKLTLYKQGIGYFEREGEINGTTASLIIPRDKINDTLKSLHIIDQNGGQILGVDYETPADKKAVLDELSIKLKDHSSMIDLLQSLRGSHVSLTFEDEQNATGRLVGVETSLDPATHMATVLIQNDADPTNIQVFPINKLQGISLQDGRAATDMSFFLDVSQTEQTRTTVTLRLSAGDHTLTISYLAPSPTWRVSYQLVSNGANKAQLIGWGIFDNVFDEDLEDVSLTLISGRPISFEYDLFESYVPSRPQVSDDPLAFESLSNNPLVAESLASISHEVRTPLNTIMGYSKLLQQDAASSLNDDQKQYVKIIEDNSNRLVELINDLLAMSKLREGGRGKVDYSSIFRYQSGLLGDLKVSSSYFMPLLIGNAEPEYLTYDVETPVSVRRNQSAMVPIVDQEVSFEEICVYNGDKMPNHPLRVWVLQNTTGKALEQGPVTLVKNNHYLGEGLVRFAGIDDEVQIPYALEFGIVVTEETYDGSTGILEIQLDSKKACANVKRFGVREFVYTLTGHVEKDTAVYIERRDANWGEYFEMPEPALVAAGHTRWAVDVPAKQEVSFTVKIRTIREINEDIKKWKRDFVESIYEDKLIDKSTYEKFERYWEGLEQNAKSAEQLELLQTEYNQLLLRQQQLRENLGALGNTTREEEIRNSVLDDLEKSENRRRDLEANITTANEQIKEFRSALSAIIREIYASGD